MRLNPLLFNSNFFLDFFGFTLKPLRVLLLLFEHIHDNLEMVKKSIEINWFHLVSPVQGFRPEVKLVVCST